MKKKRFIILALLAVSVSMFNCSKKDDDDKKPTVKTGLYGTWELDYYVENGQLVEEVDCNRKIDYQFLKNSTYTKTTYAGEGASKCVIAMVINGTWKLKSENNYELKPNGSEVSETFSVLFQDNLTKFTIAHTP